MPNAKSLKQLVEAAATAAISKQHSNGSFPPGHNGPYFDPETPVRNTAHWLYALCFLYETTGERRYAEASNRAISYLMSDIARPGASSFWCRTNPKKDSCNGLIGQAWVIEALVKAAVTLEREDCYKIAETVFLIHPWDEKRSLWFRVDTDGTKLGYDRTFNHQLWFAAAAALLENTKLAQNRAREFVANVGSRVELYSSGVVFHKSRLGALPFLSCIFPKNWKEMVSRLKSASQTESLWLKSVGYHAFNLYAFALLKKQLSASSVWETLQTDLMLKVTEEPFFLDALEMSAYGYPYNPPGIEMAFAWEVFQSKDEKAKKWIQKQVNHTYEVNTENLLTANVPDPLTSSARIYEACRLEGDYEIILPEDKNNQFEFEEQAK